MLLVVYPSYPLIKLFRLLLTCLLINQFKPLVRLHLKQLFINLFKVHLKHMFKLNKKILSKVYLRYHFRNLRRLYLKGLFINQFRLYLKSLQVQLYRLSCRWHLVNLSQVYPKCHIKVNLTRTNLSKVNPSKENLFKYFHLQLNLVWVTLVILMKCKFQWHNLFQDILDILLYHFNFIVKVINILNKIFTRTYPSFSLYIQQIFPGLLMTQVIIIIFGRPSLQCDKAT